MGATRELMLTIGPGRVTLAEVARRAGVSRMTVYRRFGSVDVLVSAVLREEMRTIITTVAAGQAPSPVVAEHVVQEAVAVVAAIRDHSMLSTVLREDPSSLLPLMVERFGSGQQLALLHLQSRLATGMASRGGDGSVVDTDPAELALAVLVTAQSFVFADTPIRTVLAADRVDPVLRRTLHSLITVGGRDD